MCWALDGDPPGTGTLCQLPGDVRQAEAKEVTMTARERALDRRERGIQVNLLQALQSHLAGLQYERPGRDYRWVAGHTAALSSVQWWANQMIEELENQ